MPNFSEWSLTVTFIAFAISGIIITIFGSRLTRIADELADVTGMGEALMGAVFLGGSTSLSGITTSVTAAASGYPELAISNAIGGIAAQTIFLAFADISYRKINLEHAAASVANIMQGALLIVLLALVILGLSGPEMTFLSIHPISFLMIGFYIFGLRLVSKAENEPMWKAQQTRETYADKKRFRSKGKSHLIKLWLKFTLFALIISGAGYVVARTGANITEQTGISQTIVGGLLTAVATSMPELVTSIAAVRQRALTLAVGGVIGGNAFDVLFVAFSDVAYRDGSIYSALTQHQLFLTGLTLLLTGILLLGLLRREKHGIGNIGFESFLVILLYFTAFIYLFLKA